MAFLKLASMINGKQDILDGLKKCVAETIDWISEQPDDDFVKGPPGKWDTSEHLDHLWQIDYKGTPILEYLSHLSSLR